MNNQSLLQFVSDRRSIRAYAERPVPKQVLKQIIETATWAPSAHNRQPWRFAIIATQVQKESLAIAMGKQLRSDLEADNVPQAVIDKDVERSYKRITSAPVAICVCMSMEDMDSYPDEERNLHERIMAIQSTAMAGQNLLLAVHAAGLGATWMCAPLFCSDIVQQELELPTDWEPQGLITLGYPAQKRKRTRQPIETKTLWR